MAYVQKRGKVWYAYVTMPPDRDHEKPWVKSFSKDPETGERWTAKRAAVDWAREYEIEARKPKAPAKIEAPRVTWDELWKRWNPHGDGDLVTPIDDNTADTYTDLYECHVAPRYGSEPVIETLATEVDKWLDRLRAGAVETGRPERRRTYAYAPRTTTAIRTLMQTMLADAAEAGLLDANPLAVKRSRARGRRVDRIQPLVRPKPGVTPEQALAAAVNIHLVIGPGTLAGLGAFMRVLTGAWSALRPGESAALDPASCHVRTPLPYLRVDDRKGTWEERRGQVPKLKHPKGGAGRDAIIPQGLAALLAAWIDYLDAAGAPDGIAFPTAESGRWPRRLWWGKWDKATTGGILALRGSNQWLVAGEYVLERAVPGLEFKGLRRAWNVWATERGIPEVARVHQLGHAMSDEMQATYSQMSSVLEAQIRAAFQDAWVEAFRGYAGIAALEVIERFAPKAASGARAALPGTRAELSI